MSDSTSTLASQKVVREIDLLWRALFAATGDSGAAQDSVRAAIRAFDGEPDRLGRVSLWRVAFDDVVTRSDGHDAQLITVSPANELEFLGPPAAVNAITDSLVVLSEDHRRFLLGRYVAGFRLDDLAVFVGDAEVANPEHAEQWGERIDAIIRRDGVAAPATWLATLERLAVPFSSASAVARTVAHRRRRRGVVISSFVAVGLFLALIRFGGLLPPQPAPAGEPALESNAARIVSTTESTTVPSLVSTTVRRSASATAPGALSANGSSDAVDEVFAAIEDETLGGTGLAVTHDGQGTLTAIDVRRQLVPWTVPFSYADPILVGSDDQIALVIRDRLRILGAVNGRDLWVSPIEPDEPPIPVAGGWLLRRRSSEGTQIALLDAVDGAALWAIDGSSSDFEVDTERALLVVLDDGGRVSLRQLPSGEPRWHVSLDRAQSIEGIGPNTVTLLDGSGLPLNIGLADGSILRP